MSKKQNQGTDKGFKEIKLDKLIIVLTAGPVAVFSVVAIVYGLGWGFSKFFLSLHEVITTSFVPWLKEVWWALLIFWAVLIVASVIFVVATQNANPKGLNSSKKETNTHNVSKSENSKEIKLSNNEKKEPKKEPTFKDYLNL